MKDRNRYIQRKSELRLWSEEVAGLVALIILLASVWVLLALVLL